MALRYHNCGDLNLLAVDDEAPLLKFFKIHFGAAFNRVIVPSSAVEALGVMKNYEVDIVISDYEMPDKDGLWFLNKVKTMYPDVSFLLISGALLSAEKEAEIIARADGYLRKPFEMEVLHQSVMDMVRLRYDLLEARYNAISAGSRASLVGPQEEAAAA